MRTVVSAFIGLACACAIAPSLSAQSVDDILAYRALLTTPNSGLVPIATSTILNEVQSGAQFALRYGYAGRSDNNAQLNNFGGTVALPVSLGSTLSFTAGVSTSSARASALMLSLAADHRLTTLPLTANRNSARIIVGLNGEFGFAKPPNQSFVVGQVGVPFSLVTGDSRRDAVRIVPYVTPEFGFANIASDNAARGSGSMFLFGGGLAVYSRSSPIAVNIGFQYPSIQNGTTMVGVAMVLGGR